ncbi:hypothetical protein RU639_000629 [Aspergillus parasiticus]
MSDDDQYRPAQNQIRFKIENQTSFDLEPQGSYDYFGEFIENPSEIKPNSSDSAGHIMGGRFGGSAGMVGYKITGDSETLYLRFLATNPILSAKDNDTNSAILDNDAGIDKSNYNLLLGSEKRHDARSFNGGTLMVHSMMGQRDDATATFTITFN